MTKPATHSGFYVTAILDGGTGNQRTAWLAGPFTGPRGHMAALAMVTPARRAVLANSDDPRFAFAGFGTAKMTLPIDKPLPAGRMAIEWLSVDDIIFVSIAN